jgi:hypothetical protein
MLGDRNLLSLDASLAILTRVLHFEASRRQQPERSDRPPWAVRPDRRSDCPTWVVRPAWVAVLPRRLFVLGFVAQPSNLVVFGGPLQTRELGVASTNLHS